MTDSAEFLWGKITLVFTTFLGLISYSYCTALLLVYLLAIRELVLVLVFGILLEETCLTAWLILCEFELYVLILLCAVV